MAAAFRYAEGDGHKPGALVLLDAIDRFGVAAVMGRPTLGALEMRRMALSENVVRAYQERNRAENWAAWAKENPEHSDLLAMAARAAEEGE